MKPLFFAMPDNEAAANALAKALGGATGELELRRFPDGESYLRFAGDLAGQTVALVCTLDRPNEKTLPLLFAAATARELGAAKVGLVAPYLAYMRQDKRFNPGEAVTSREFARLLSDAFDWLVTVDPHLHRYKSLSEIYRIPTCVVHAAPLMAAWIKANVEQPVIIGPDVESKQWVAAVAKQIAASYAVFDKIRRGDREVEIKIKNLDAFVGHTPVLVDDIISSGQTMLAAIRLLKDRGLAAPVCIAVHGVIATGAYEALLAAGARVVTCNTVPHASNAIDVNGLLGESLRTLVRS